MPWYRFKVTHDEGSINIRTFASSAQIAKKMIMKAESCPKRSLKLIENE